MEQRTGGGESMRSTVGRLWMCAAAVVAVMVALPGTAMAAAPTATTWPATNITSTSASFNGTGNTGGHQATWRFEYATDADFTESGYTESTDTYFFGFRIDEFPGLATQGDSGLTLPVRGLEPLTVYHYRLVIEQNA